MADRFNPLVSIDKFRYADSSRTQKRREPGSCPTLLNLSPNQGEGERIRRGYGAYTTITPPTGMQKFFILPIQTPTQEDVFLWMADNGGQAMYQNPWWDGTGTKQTSNTAVQTISEHLGNTTTRFNPNNADVSFPAANQMKIANYATTDPNYALSGTTNYYKGWRFDNYTQSEMTLVSAYSISGVDATFTFVGDVNSSGLNWLTSDEFIIYRNNHHNPTFAPAYNNNLTSPPFAIADISRLYFSGGLSSSTGNAAMISQYVSRTFFPGVSSRSYTMTQTYVSEERLSALPAAELGAVSSIGGGSTLVLTTGKTYWWAVAAIYDGFQLGELTKYETPSDYSLGTGWTQNYLGTSSIFVPSFVWKINLGRLNKRITGFALFISVDDNDVRSTGRHNPYQYIGQISTISSDNSLNSWGGSGWTYVSSSTESYFRYEALVDQGVINAKSTEYIDASGMEETPPDTSYSYSSRLVLNDKHYLSNVYISSEAVTNREEIFTNPRGGLAGVNSGINQPSLFPNDQGFFRKGIELAIGTKINCMAKVGMGELLTVKDRGVILNRVIEESDGTIQLVSQILDQNIGCATLNGFTQLDADEGGLIFFAGYDDIYLYDNSRFKRLIERQDQQDWLYQYREVISKSAKEAIVLTYLPEGILLMDINQASSQQFALYTQYIPDGWRQVRFKQASGLAASGLYFGQFGKLQNGTVIGLSTEGTPALYQFSNPTTGAYYYSDAGTSIKPSFFTGELVTGLDVSRDTWFDRWVIPRYFDHAMLGTLDCIIYKDGQVLRTTSSMDKTSVYLKSAVRSDDVKIGNTWGLWYNTNSSPEVLDTTNYPLADFRILSVRGFGHSKNRTRISDGGYTSVTIPPDGNTVSGVREVILNRTPQTFTWDTAFTQTYTSPTEGAGIPSYSIEEASTPYVVGSDRTQRPQVIIDERTLTTWTAHASEDNVLFRFNTIGS